MQTDEGYLEGKWYNLVLFIPVVYSHEWSWFILNAGNINDIADIYV